jgi:hypothetical protein
MIPCGEIQDVNVLTYIYTDEQQCLCPLISFVSEVWERWAFSWSCQIVSVSICFCTCLPVMRPCPAFWNLTLKYGSQVNLLFNCNESRPISLYGVKAPSWSLLVVDPDLTWGSPEFGPGVGAPHSAEVPESWTWWCKRLSKISFFILLALHLLMPSLGSGRLVLIH